MKSEEYIKDYVKAFNYKEVKYPDRRDKKMYLKKVEEGFIIIESLDESKYVYFYLNEKSKTFKKSDLLLCAIEQTPAAWEAENEQ